MSKEKPINLNYIDDLLNRIDNLCDDVLKCDILNQAFAAIHQILSAIYYVNAYAKRVIFSCTKHAILFQDACDSGIGDGKGTCGMT